MEIRPSHRAGAARTDATHTRRAWWRALMVLVLATLPLLGSITASAATGVATPDTAHLAAVGPVNSEYGFPSWYEDGTGRRLEPCLDGGNPYCGFLAGAIPNVEAPISFPDNFPEELFYHLVGASLTLPNGGKATLTQGLEAAFANGAPVAGDQQVFGRQRIVVKGAPPNAPLRFTTPYGVITIDTDVTGAGRVVEDISPAIGNFATPLKSNIAPFLTWDTGTITDPQGNVFVGDPAVAHKVTGSPFGTNVFAVTGGGLNISTDQLTIQGKVATNTGVEATAAKLSADGRFLDVFATSKGDQVQVDGSPTPTPMAHDRGSDRFYARLALNGEPPAQVTVRNLGDKPVSTSTIAPRKPSGITIGRADYDGATGTVTVAATSSKGEALTATGLGPVTDPAGTRFTATAPPDTVTVTATSGTATAPVEVVGGDATPGQPTVAPQPDPGPVVVSEGGTPTTTTPTVTASAARTTVNPGDTTTLTASGPAGATYAWTQTGGTPTTLSSTTTATPTVTVPFAASVNDTAPRAAPTATGPAVFSVVATANGVASAPATVSVAVQTDDLAITANRHRLGQELRITGTSRIGGNVVVLNPTAQVVVWDTTPVGGKPRNVKLGAAPVDSLGNWSLVAKPGPGAQVTSAIGQSTRGGTFSTTVTTK